MTHPLINHPPRLSDLPPDKLREALNQRHRDHTERYVKSVLDHARPSLLARLLGKK